MELTDIFFLVVGVLGTWWGAEMLVRGAVHLALRWGVSPLVVGLTVVAFGTSSPEAVVSFVAAGRGSADIALGNVLGSNIANLGLILSIVALLHPLRVQWRELRVDMGLMLLFTSVVAVSLWFGWLGRPAGILLLLCQVAMLVSYARATRRVQRNAIPVEEDTTPIAPAVAQAVVGLALLAMGANWLVRGAVAAALALGIPEAVVGATMVAVGTSLPELAASVVAMVKGQQEIGIGNLIGSNIMNLLFVLGGVATISSAPLTLDGSGLLLATMLAFSFGIWPILALRQRVGRPEGAVLLAAYVAFAVMVYV